MGTFHYTIEVGDPQGDRFETVEALVDTGATYTTLPSSMLRRLSVRPFTRRQFRLTDERVLEYELGQTWIRLNGEAIIRLVVFSESEQAMLWADTLEGFGLAVDPVGKRLLPVPALLMALLTTEAAIAKYAKLVGSAAQGVVTG